MSSDVDDDEMVEVPRDELRALLEFVEFDPAMDVAPEGATFVTAFNRLRDAGEIDVRSF